MIPEKLGSTREVNNEHSQYLRENNLNKQSHFDI